MNATSITISPKRFIDEIYRVTKLNDRLLKEFYHKAGVHQTSIDKVCKRKVLGKSVRLRLEDIGVVIDNVIPLKKKEKSSSPEK